MQPQRVRIGEELSLTGGFAQKGRELKKLCSGIEVCVRKIAQCTQFVSLCDFGRTHFCGWVSRVLRDGIRLVFCALVLCVFFLMFLALACQIIMHLSVSHVF